MRSTDEIILEARAVAVSHCCCCEAIVFVQRACLLRIPELNLPCHPVSVLLETHDSQDVCFTNEFVDLVPKT